MKSVLKFLAATGVLVGLSLSVPANAQQQAPQAPQLKPCTPAAQQAATEILTFKKAKSLYANIVPNIVMQTKDTLMTSNLNLQKDLNEVAPIIAQSLAGKESEVGEGMAQVYCNEFTEQELKDLVAFYKTPLGQKLLSTEPRAIQFSMSYMNAWAQNFAEIVNGQFRAEMRKRGKNI